jgi:undecaprenyl-diphosphatase
LTVGDTLLAHDARLSAALRDVAARMPWLRRLAIPIARSGDGWIWLVVAGVVAAIGGAPLWSRMALVVIAILATALAVKLGKMVTGRARPAGDWGGSYRRSDPHAFPSGHAARAGLLVVLAFALGPPGLGVLAVVWALLVASSRVALGVHYVSDVVAGLVLGLCCGAIAVSV